MRREWTLAAGPGVSSHFAGKKALIQMRISKQADRHPQTERHTLEYWTNIIARDIPSRTSTLVTVVLYSGLLSWHNSVDLMPGK